MKSILLQARGLCKTFTNDKVVANVIRNLDLEIYAGDFTVIMGTSGAGKSTLLYLLSGLDSVIGGEITLQDIRIDQLKEREMTKLRRSELGFVFQETNLIDDFNVLENVVMSGYLNSKDRRAVNSYGETLLTKVNMLEHQHKYPSQLSGGQKQRVAIARSLINQPSILFADEPTGALNATQSENVLDLLTEINENGQSIVMVTHDIKAAARANRLIFLNDGKVDGVLDLDQYDAVTLTAREKQVFDFVMSKGW